MSAFTTKNTKMNIILINFLLRVLRELRGNIKKSQKIRRESFLEIYLTIPKNSA
jgi:hypothetical protein